MNGINPLARWVSGRAIFSYGFRPFFLFGSLYAGLIIPAWLLLFYGTAETRSAFSPLDWHIHETMFGSVAAIITGFLLTAIPNWTRRLPVQGLPLLALLLTWIMGRAAVFYSVHTGWLLAAVLDCSFLAAVTATAAREIVVGRNWRNLKVILPVTIFLFANVLFHAEAALSGTSIYAARLALAAVIVLIMIIGGRIVPSFTHNWILSENPGRLPVSFNKFDAVTILLSIAALLFWVPSPEGMTTGILLLAAGALNLARLARWAGNRAARDALVLILHVGYLFVPVGLLLSGLAALDPVRFPAVAAVHAFGVGAIGTMMLAVMTRATLGHIGHELLTDVPTQLIYVAIVLAALLRIISAFMPSQPLLLNLSGVLWSLAFLGYCTRYGSMILQPRRSRLATQPAKLHA